MRTNKQLKKKKEKYIGINLNFEQNTNLVCIIIYSFTDFVYYVVLHNPNLHLQLIL